MIDFDGDGKIDLVAVLKHNGATHLTEVHVLSGESNFQTFSLQSTTVLGATDNNEWDFVFPPPSTFFISISNLALTLGNSCIDKLIKKHPNGSIEFFSAVRINGKETEYFLNRSNPKEMAEVAAVALHAVVRSYAEFGTFDASDGQFDAVKHCFIAASLSRRLGLEKAQELLSMHENTTNPEQIDNFNNGYGYEVFQSNPYGTDDQHWGSCVVLGNNQQLKFKGNEDPRPKYSEYKSDNWEGGIKLANGLTIK